MRRAILSEPGEKWNLKAALGSVRPPAPAVIAIASFALALMIGTIAGLEDSESGLPVLTRLWRWYVTDFATAATVTLGVIVARRLTPPFWYSDRPNLRSFALSYGTYLVIGLVGGLVRFALSNAVDVPPINPSFIHQAARAGAIPVGMLLIGFLANQYRVFLDNIRDHERLLRQRIEELKRENQERLVAERAATTKEQRLSAMLRSASEGVVLADRGGSVVLLNPAAERIVGWTSDAATGRPLAEVLPRLVNDGAMDLLANGPGGVTHEVEIRGSARFLEAVVAPITEGPEAGGRLILIRDVTEARLAEQRAGQEERLTSLGKLAAGIAHDFNNLLTTIIGGSEVLKSRDDLPKPAQNMVTLIYEGGLRASRLVQQIMDFSRQRPVAMSPTDIASVLVNFQEMLKPAIPENVQVQLNVASDQAVVHGNAQQMEQVFMNLAINAGQAMPEGGTFTITLSRTPAAVTDIQGRGHEWIRIEFADTGLGIAPENIDKIFDPFFTTKAPSIGTGLGLAQVHGIVRQHSGAVTVASRLGIGTTFTIWLPALPAQTPVPGRGSQQTVLRGHGETILLVEDDELVLEVVQSMLEHLGYRVLTAHDGQDALDVYGANNGEIAAVITDVTMPIMGGFELYRILRDRYPGVKLIALTGHAFNEETRQHLASGMVDWLEKPPDTAVLARTLRRVLETGPASPADPGSDLRRSAGSS